MKGVWRMSSESVGLHLKDVLLEQFAFYLQELAHPVGADPLVSALFKISKHQKTQKIKTMVNTIVITLTRSFFPLNKLYGNQINRLHNKYLIRIREVNLSLRFLKFHGYLMGASSTKTVPSRCLPSYLPWALRGWVLSALVFVTGVALYSPQNYPYHLSLLAVLFGNLSHKTKNICKTNELSVIIPLS